MSDAKSLVGLPVGYGIKGQDEPINIEMQRARNATKVFEAYVKARREKRQGGN